jgi:thiol-disulfide isomerase/thioredoxin
MNRFSILFSLTLIPWLCAQNLAFAQTKADDMPYTVSGTFIAHANQSISLNGFDGFDSYTIQSTKADSNGYFSLRYALKDLGMGFLKAGGGKPFILVLSGEDIVFEGEAFEYPAGTTVLQGSQNQALTQYASDQPRREQAQSAWSFLDKIYNQDSLFSIHDEPREAIATEVKRLKAESKGYLANLDDDSYVKWFLPVRQLVSSVSAIAQYRTEEIPEAIETFRRMDFTDSKLYKSGLLREALEGHYWLLENSGRPLDSVYVEMNKSTDRLLDFLIFDEEKLNEITDHLFNFMEKRSLFEASEYLAVKVLNEVSCTIDDKLAKQLEGYRTMKKGNIAPDIVFAPNTLGPADKKIAKLSDIKDSRYTVIAFAAGWCGHCQKEIPKLAKLYPKLQQNDIEVALISLDDNKADYQKFAANLPFFSSCDFKKWDGKAVEDYHVFGTPTFYIVDKDLKIYIRPKSVDQIEALADYNLKKKD